MSDKEVDEILKETCLEMEKRYEVKYFEVGTDNDRVHFQIQSVLTCSAKKFIQTAKSILARRYVQEQGKEEEYKKIYSDEQLKLF